MIDDHRGLALRSVGAISATTAVLAIALVATGRAGAVLGLLAGAAVGVADVFLLARSLTRFAGGTAVNPRALGLGMLTRFLAVGALLGLVLCVRTINPLAALVGFLLMPASVAVVGARASRRSRTTGAIDAVSG